MTDVQKLLVNSLSSSSEIFLTEYNRNKCADNWIKGVKLSRIIESAIAQRKKLNS